jgi:hypothetical protein
LSIEERLESLEKRMQKLEESLAANVSATASKPYKVEALVISRIREIETQDLVVIALKLKPKQKKGEVKAMLQDLGARVGNWFEGGNLNTRMVNSNIVKKAETKEGVVFSLTKKGEFLANEVIDKIKLKK